MRNQEKIASLIIFCALIILLVPFVYLFTLTFPYGDDIGRAQIQDYYAAIKRWLTKENGRYFNAVFTSIPVYKNIFLYRLSCFIITVFQVFGVYYFLKFFLDRSGALFLALFALCVAWLYIPVPQNYYFWFATQTNYIFSIGIFFLLSRILLNNLQQEGIALGNMIKIVVLLFVGIGSIELFAAPALMALFYFSCYKLWKESWNQFERYLFLNVYAFLNAISLLYIPGSRHRQGRFKKNMDLWNSVYTSFEETAAYLLEHLFSLPTLLTFIFVFVIVKLHGKIRQQIPFQLPLFSLMAMISFMIGIYFIVTYSTGLAVPLKQSQSIPRVYAYFHNSFVIFWMICCVVLSLYLQSFPKIYNAFKNSSFIFYMVGFVVILVLGIQDQNLKVFYNEYTSGVYKRYHQEIEIRRKAYAGQYENLNLLQLSDEYYLPAIRNKSKLLYWREPIATVYEDKSISKKVRLFLNTKFDSNLSLKGYDLMKKVTPFEKDDVSVYWNKNLICAKFSLPRKAKKYDKLLIDFVDKENLPATKELPMTKQHCCRISKSYYCFWVEKNLIERLSDIKSIPK